MNVTTKKIYIPKNDGTKRILYVPQDKEHIDWLNNASKTLATLDMPVYMCAFTRGRCVFNYVKPHLLRISTGKAISLDIYRCFDKITKNTIINGINFYIKNTNITNKQRMCLQDIKNNINYVAPEGFLPQGFCTSPVLANISLYPSDEEIINSLKSDMSLEDLVYTRYADNILISSMKIDSYEHRKLIVNSINDIYKKFGLSLNRDKIKLFIKPNNKYVKICGISINTHERITRLNRKMRHRLRGVRYRIEVIGDKNKNIMQLYNGICGYGKMISTDWDSDYKNVIKGEQQ